MRGCETVGVDDVVLVGAGIGGVGKEEEVISQGLEGYWIPARDHFGSSINSYFK